MMETAESRPWSDLQPELLGLVLRRLPSIADRVRLRAVCHPWRSNSLLQPLTLPSRWLILPDGTFLSIPDGEIHHMPVPVGACCCGSVYDWLFLMSSDGGCSLLNPFSKTTLDLPELAKVWKRNMSNPTSRSSPVSYKLVVPSPLDSSPDSLVAALITDYDNCATLHISQTLIATDSFRDDQIPLLHIKDVAFFDGKLYALCGFGKLCIIQVGKELCISSTECIGHSLYGMPRSLIESDKSSYKLVVYLVECGGTLLTVKRWIEPTLCPVSGFVLRFEHTVAFEVFEADLSTNPGRWRRATELGGHALFLGRRASNSMPATECTGYRQDCIYFMGDYSGEPHSVNPLLDSGVYNMRNGKITELLPGAAATSAHHDGDGQWHPTWFFPPETV